LSSADLRHLHDVVEKAIDGAPLVFRQFDHVVLPVAGELIPQIVIEARGGAARLTRSSVRISAAAAGHSEAPVKPFRVRRGLLAAQGKAPARSRGRDGHPLPAGTAADLNGFSVSGAMPTDRQQTVAEDAGVGPVAHGAVACACRS